MQGVEGRGLLRHCSEELKILDAPIEPADAAGGKEDHLVRKRGARGFKVEEVKLMSTHCTSGMAELR